MKTQDKGIVEINVPLLIQNELDKIFDPKKIMFKVKWTEKNRVCLSIKKNNYEKLKQKSMIEEWNYPFIAYILSIKYDYHNNKFYKLYKSLYAKEKTDGTSTYRYIFDVDLDHIIDNLKQMAIEMFDKDHNISILEFKDCLAKEVK